MCIICADPLSIALLKSKFASPKDAYSFRDLLRNYDVLSLSAGVRIEAHGEVLLLAPKETVLWDAPVPLGPRRDPHFSTETFEMMRFFHLLSNTVKPPLENKGLQAVVACPRY